MSTTMRPTLQTVPEALPADHVTTAAPAPAAPATTAAPAQPRHPRPIFKITCCMKNVDDADVEENTFKHYYFPLSDDEGSSYQPYTKRSIETIDEFFEEPKKKKRKCSSTVGRSTKDGMSYISTNSDDGTGAAHLIKIEVYNLKKLANIEQDQHWKHAEVRVKYYAKPGNKFNDRTREIIYAITKEIATKEDCKKYFYKNKDE